MNPSCPFCAIGRGDLPATMTYEDEEVIAFKDAEPVAPFHELVVPRRHIPSLASATDADQALLGKVMLVARQRADEAGYRASGFRVVMNHGRDGHQTVGHIHLHLLAGRALGWPPG